MAMMTPHQIPVLNGYVETVVPQGPGRLQAMLRLETEKRVHRVLERIVAMRATPLKIRVPRLLGSTIRYIQEELPRDRLEPLWHESAWTGLSVDAYDSRLRQLALLWKRCSTRGLFLRGVEAYVDRETETIWLTHFTSAYWADPSPTPGLESDRVLPQGLIRVPLPALDEEDPTGVMPRPDPASASPQGFQQDPPLMPLEV